MRALAGKTLEPERPFTEPMLWSIRQMVGPEMRERLCVNGEEGTMAEIKKRGAAM